MVKKESKKNIKKESKNGIILNSLEKFGFRKAKVLDVNFTKKKKLVQFAFRNETPKDKTFIKNAVKTLVKEIKVRQAKNSVDVGGRVFINTLYDETFGWRAGHQFKFDEEISVFDPNNEYEVQEGKKFQNKFKHFNVIIETYPKAGGMDKFNNCLYTCLLQFYNFQNMVPEIINSPNKLKRKLGVHWSEPVPLCKVIDVLQNVLRVNINIQGDEIYTSEKKYPFTMTLMFSDGHYELVKRKKNKNLCFDSAYSYKNYPERRINLYFNVDKQQCYYNGKQIKPMKTKHWKIARSLMNSTKNTFHNFKKPLLGQDVKTVYETHLEAIEWLKKNTNNKIDMRHHTSFAKCAIWFFERLRNFTEPEHIEQDEGRFIQFCYRGGIRYCERKNVTLEQGYEYDFSSYYPSIMKSQMKLPVKRGEICTLEKLESSSTNFFSIPYGIYRLKVGKTDCKYFMKNLKKFYTHYDVKIMHENNIEYSLIQDGQPNAIIYTTDKLMLAQDLFGNFVKYFTELKNKKNAPGMVKGILNSLWGKLCSANYVYSTGTMKDVSVKEGFEYLMAIDTTEENYDGKLMHHQITSIDYIDDHKAEVRLQDYKNNFKYSYARIGPFLTSYGRFKLYETFRNHTDSIKWIHTDGLVTDTPITSYTKLCKKGFALKEISGKVCIMNKNQKKFL